MLLHEFYCATCNRDTSHFDHKCSICMANEHQATEAAWKLLSADDKVERLRKRIQALEEMPLLR